MTDETIIQLFRDQKESIQEIINANATLTRATFKAEIDRVDERIGRIEKTTQELKEYDEKQNGTLAKHDKQLKSFERFHSIFQYLVKKPIITIVIIVAFFSLIVWIHESIDIKETIENITKFVFKD